MNIGDRVAVRWDAQPYDVEDLRGTIIHMFTRNGRPSVRVKLDLPFPPSLASIGTGYTGEEVYRQDEVRLLSLPEQIGELA